MWRAIHSAHWEKAFRESGTDVRISVKVGHVTYNISTTPPVWKAFFDGRYIGSYATVDQAKSMVELEAQNADVFKRISPAG